MSIILRNILWGKKKVVTLRIELFILEDMKNRNIFLSFLVLVCLVGFPSVISAAEPGNDYVWSSRPSSHSGLYAHHSAFSSLHGLRISIDGLYYFGDMEAEGFSLGRPNVNNMSSGVTVSYIQPLSVVNMRYGIQAGWLHGNNSKADANGESYGGKQRSFNSWFIRPAIGVEWYPFSRLGLYVYGGVGVAISCVDYYVLANYSSQRENSGENAFHFLPMIPLELGYNFKLGKGNELNIHLGGSFGLVDSPSMNLDGWATPDGLDGTSDANKFTDGYLELGIAYSFNWQRKCEVCRLAR